MAIEKKWEAIPPRAFTADGGTEGQVSISSTIDFKVKQKVILKANSQSGTLLEVKRVVSETLMIVGLPGNINNKSDISTYTVADSATIESLEQDRVNIPYQEHENAVYAEEPIVAKRVIQVDRLGRYFHVDNPFPSEIIFQRNGGPQQVIEDTLDPLNNRPLPVKLTGFTGDVSISADNLNLETQTEGVYDSQDNPNPDNIGLVLQTRNITSSDSRQVERPTAKRGTEDTDSVSSDVALHDKNGNGLESRVYGTQRGLKTSIMDGGQKDSFDRIRTSSIISLFNAYHSQSSHDLFFENSITGTASATHVPARAAMQLSVGITSGDQIIRQTRRYIHYNPGRSYMVTLSGTFGSPKTNVRKRWGYFDANDGLFFEQLETGLRVVQRTSTSGSPVDTIVTQANFNLDKFDGTGLSGINLNVNTHNLYVIDYVWQGAGRVRFGIVFDGEIVYCHEFQNSNTINMPFMRTPSLPIRLELTNTGTTVSPTSYDFVCLSANKESTDVTVPSYVFSANRGAINISVGSGNISPVISIRPKLLFNSIVNRTPVKPIEVPIISISNPLLVQIFLNGTLTGATFNSVGTNSATEYDIAATAITGGVLVKSFYVGGLSGQAAVTSFVTLSDILFLGLNIAGNQADIMTVVVTNLGSGSTSINAGVVFEEYQ